MTSSSSLAGASIALLGLLFYAYSNPSAAVSSPRIQAQQSAVTTFTYAQLRVEEERFIFDPGGLEIPRARSLSALMRLFGSAERATYVNLLNAIGSRGWEIVEIDTIQSIVTFKRQL